MGRLWLVVTLSLGTLLVGGRASADDFENDLLRKFQKQNNQDTQQVKSIIEKNLAEALLLGPQEPEKALVLLRHARELLADATKLPRSERDMLNKRLDDGFRDAKARLESLDAQRKAEFALKPALTTPGTMDDDSDKGKKPRVSPIFFRPNIAQIPSGGSFSTTPIVSADRRWVRISFSGSFTFLSGLRFR